MDDKPADIYLICSVTNATDKDREYADAYVKALEARGHKVHYPPRDVDQNGTGTEICEAHRAAMYKADEVHVIWNPDSKGSHFDFGMAYMLRFVVRDLGDMGDVKIVLVNDPGQTETKTYGNVLCDLQEEQDADEGTNGS